MFAVCDDKNLEVCEKAENFNIPKESEIDNFKIF